MTTRDPKTQASRDSKAANGTSGEQGTAGDGGQRLTWPARRFLALMGLPALGLALSSTIVTTYLPKLLVELSGPATIGLIIGSEGLFALLVPVVVGSWSDTVRTRLGGRLPFLLAAAPLMATALVLMPLVGSIAAIAPLVMVFFAGYFAYYAPYRALYPDLVADELRGRSQGAQKTLREAGLGGALVLGGVLLGVWRPLPFLFAALVVTAVTAAFLVAMRGSWDREGRAGPSRRERVPDALRRAASMTRESSAIRWLLIANGLWEFTLAALKTFVVLFITVGLGLSIGLASAVLAIAAAAAVAGALLSGKLADRVGELAIIRRGVWIYAFGLLIPLFFHSIWVIAAVPVVALAAAALMTLPYSLLMRLMPDESHGASAGVFDFSRGAGTLLGPLVAGVAIELLEPVLTSTEGYAAVFAVCSAAVFLSIPVTRRMAAEAPAGAAPA